MTLVEFNDYLNGFLQKENFREDPSANGIQIQNSLPYDKQIKTVAFAVDACEQSSQLASANNADVLVVHHGIFWGHCSPITDSHYKRVSSFIKNDLALIAYHIPLDANNPYGNNFGLAHKINLAQLEPFGKWKGMTIGVKGMLDCQLSLNELSDIISKNTNTKPDVYNFGKEKIQSVGIVSGGAGDLVEQAALENLDVYVTGAFEHEDFHVAQEMGINVISAGHYGTEIIGVSLLKEKVEKELGLNTVFLDLPTGL